MDWVGLSFAIRTALRSSFTLVALRVALLYLQFIPTIILSSRSLAIVIDRSSKGLAVSPNGSRVAERAA